MSYRYEVVFGCFLRDDTPESVLDTLRWHMGWLGLLSRSYWLDDDIGWVFDLIEFIAPYVATRGYGGFIREVDEVVPTVFAFAGGGFGLTQQWGKIPLWKS